MDNASKALIMAGAILIAIAIVGLGVFLLNSTTNTRGQAAEFIDSQAIAAANGTLDKYVGTSVKGTQVQEFLEQVRLANVNGRFPVDLTKDSNGTFSIANNGTITGGNIRPTGLYDISLSDSNSDGYYDHYKVVAHPSATPAAPASTSNPG